VTAWQKTELKKRKANARKNPDAGASWKTSNAESGGGMAEQFSLRPESEQDVAEVFEWYEQQEPGLGEELLRCVDACILATEEILWPTRFAEDSFCRALVRRFPLRDFLRVRRRTDHDLGRIPVAPKIPRSGVPNFPSDEALRTGVR